ncbi:MAG: Hpt domain-containing protein [Treponema sp.]|nr:Hpt domain-containing protein [Treponema sp.]
MQKTVNTLPVSHEIRRPLESDMEFKRTLQLHFLKNNQEKYDEVVNALTSGDMPLAYRLVHNLKSNAGHIGQVGLQEAAAEVEQMLKKEESPVTEEQLQILKNELFMVLHTLSSLLDEPAVQSDAGSQCIASGNTGELLERLEMLLERGNPECVYLVNELRIIPDSDRLIQQIEDFDFKMAMAELSELRKKGSFT